MGLGLGVRVGYRVGVGVRLRPLAGKHRLTPVEAAHAGRRRRQRVLRGEDLRGQLAPLRPARLQVLGPEGGKLRLGAGAQRLGIRLGPLKVERA